MSSFSSVFLFSPWRCTLDMLKSFLSSLNKLPSDFIKPSFLLSTRQWPQVHLEPETHTYTLACLAQCCGALTGARGWRCQSKTPGLPVSSFSPACSFLRLLILSLEITLTSCCLMALPAKQQDELQTSSWTLWKMSVIPVIWEAEARQSDIQDQPEKLRRI